MIKVSSIAELKEGVKPSPFEKEEDKVYRFVITVNSRSPRVMSERTYGSALGAIGAGSSFVDKYFYE